MRLTRPRPTIRTRLTGAATAMMMLMLAVASFSIIAIQRQELIAGIDETLRQRADNLEPISDINALLPAEGDPEDSFVQLFDQTGLLVATSDNVRGSPAVRLQPDDLRVAHITTRRIDRPAGGRYRVLVRPATTGQQTRVLVIGKNVDDVAASVHTLIVTLGVVSPILALILGVLAWWLTGRTLRPVAAIRNQVRDIDGGGLHRRVPVPDIDDEIAELARTMNGMLDRVESASIRQQQFVDDASHELRTPLTRMMTDLEVAIAHPDREPSQATLRRVHEDSIDLYRLLHDLLYLARTSHDAVAAQDEVDLDDIALRAVLDLRARTTLTVDTTGVTAARVIGDAHEIDRAVRNLLDNASRHASTTVAIATSTTDGQSQVVVDDDGAGIRPKDRAAIFERFTRLDEARTDGGAGLGLAIVAAIARRHRGHVDVDDAPLGGARFTLTMPRDTRDEH